MKNSFGETRQLLSMVMDFVSRSSEGDLRSLLDGTARLGIIERTSLKSAQKPTAKVAFTDEDLRDLFLSLSSLESRELGIRLLEERVPNRKSLEALARRIDMPVRKEDNIERMRDRIVEQTIGSRLNSRAIQGNSGNSSGNKET